MAKVKCPFSACESVLLPIAGADPVLLFDKFDTEANDFKRGWRVHLYCSACKSTFFRIIEMNPLP